jgi:putative transposase
MPRVARAIVPDVAVHVIQRGNNRGACFFGGADYVAYLRYLGRFAPRCGCSIHAYCLMTNHVHLLMTPHASDACARLMKSLGQHYVQYVNRARKRSGTLWEGRFRSSLVATERYALACYRYIELNPVRAGLVAVPREYRWSSYRRNAEYDADALLTPHPAFLSLSDDPAARRGQYRGLFEASLDPRLVDEIRGATRSGRALGQAPKSRGRPTENRDRPYFQHSGK